ncbi:MAG TPA: hypothetical protein VHE30_06375 [Polyangiaceae bacterium]|nr:hypothetical protein [Polyangiaceae bacterium]
MPGVATNGSGAPRHSRLSLALAAAFALGCAGHAAETEGARNALDAGRPKEALRLLNERLDVASAKDAPAKISGDASLFLLDRAMVLQEVASESRERAPAEYQWSSRDLELADKQIEVLDLSRGAMADIGRYLFSDDTGAYKAPTYEKLMINTMNLVSYLVRADLNGARIEARRLAVMQKFVAEHENQGASLTGPGSYLAGFAFEKSGKPDEALRFYDEALQYGAFESLSDPVKRLLAIGSYRTPRLREVAGERKADAAPDAPPAEPSSPPPDDESGEILVVVNFGRVPAKVAKRIPIGLALTYVSGALSPTDASRANYLAAQGLVTWVNYPELGKGRGAYETPGFALDGAWQRLEGTLAVDEEARKAWEDAKGAVIASAITRMITRVAAGEAVRRGSGGGIVGALLSLGTQATLTAVDTPDTRSWATLPARVAIGRVRVAPGTHWVDLEARGVRKRQAVTIAPRGFAVLNLTVLR